jgi:hypothetical protein
MVGIDQFLEELRPLNLAIWSDFTVFRTLYLHLIFGTLLGHTKIQINLSLVSIHWFSPKVWPLERTKYHELSVFITFFSLSAYRFSFDI